MNDEVTINLKQARYRYNLFDYVLHLIQLIPLSPTNLILTVTLFINDLIPNSQIY